ncbi:flagellar filament capping protein FliD [Paenibacillus chibensis]|uniref:flagellar filament capping protein FliD n=1 Tax=Paenibacillus chibensis TaxID=59846 RepID=UPI000FD8F336|nr:flagellar filament capping protein FliD [Paenibacillus chibensis]MEC0370803.1 flagellar filament capping protein FliD [Paenibacillus chibensis]
MATISFAGLASGFNSTSYIEAVMKQESIPLTNLQTKKTNTTAYKNTFDSINTKLQALKDAAYALKDKSVFQQTSATSSDTTKVSVTAGESAFSGSYQVDIVNLARSQQSNSTAFDSSTDFSTLPDMLNFGTDKDGNAINVDIKDAKGKNLDDALKIISDRINAAGIGINAAVIETSSDKRVLTLTAAKSGEAGKFTNPTDSFFGFVTDPNQAAKDATVKVNGIEITSSTNELKNAVPGVTLQLNATGTSTVKVAMDSDKVASKVEAFVKAYNDVINSIRDVTKKSEKNSDGTLTLTLQGDSTLRDLQSQLNDMMNNIMGNSDGYRLLGEIGLEVDKGVTSASLMTGNITFDKDKFKTKLAQNPQALQNMFTSIATRDDDNKVTSGFDGLGALFDDKLKLWTNTVDGIMTSKIKGYTSDISYIDEQITSMQERLDMREANLKKQYANLEVVMTGLNNQKDWITSQVAQLNKSSK